MSHPRTTSYLYVTPGRRPVYVCVTLGRRSFYVCVTQGRRPIYMSHQENVLSMHVSPKDDVLSLYVSPQEDVLSIYVHTWLQTLLRLAVNTLWNRKMKSECWIAPVNTRLFSTCTFVQKQNKETLHVASNIVLSWPGRRDVKKSKGLIY